MRFGKIFLLASFLFASVANAQDVMVDLSVLDDLDVPYKNVSKPLFPVLPKKTEAKVKKSVKQQKTDSSHLKKQKAEKAKPIKEDVEVVDFEPVSKSVKNEKPVAPAVEEPKPVAPVAEESKSVEAPVIEEPKPVAPVAEEPKSVEAPVVEEPKPDLLISEDKKATIDETSYIRFTPDVDELNNEQKAKIDSIVSGYQNGPKNKIAIYSYNFDDGVDSFKKKRTSLNRAVEIRSYLLKKGYKNFSIKVINISNASDKNNMVELQEI